MSDSVELRFETDIYKQTHFCVFLKILLRKLQFHSNLMIITVTLHEVLCTRDSQMKTLQVR